MGNEIIRNEKSTALLASKTQQWIMASLNDSTKGIAVPKGYNIGNEIETALFYIAQNTDAFQKCPEASIMSALRDMVMQGLSISKKQIYPIVYGNQLQMQRSYFGTITALKYLFPNYQVTANVIYKGDKYEYRYDEIGNYYYITNVQSSLENRDGQIVAAFGTIYDTSAKERIYGCVMTWAEIQKNWAKAKTHNVQNDFPAEMAKRTLINRMCKMFVNTVPNLNSEVVGAFNRSTEAEYENMPNVTPEEESKQQMLHSKSKGTAGLAELLSNDGKKQAVDAPISEEGEIIQEEPENASEATSRASEAKVEAKAPAEKAEESPKHAEDDLLSDEIPF